ncbi:hypothetical protein AOLI_G00165250 [Acnodon oligacanthus]
MLDPKLPGKPSRTSAGLLEATANAIWHTNPTRSTDVLDVFHLFGLQDPDGSQMCWAERLRNRSCVDCQKAVSAVEFRGMTTGGVLKREFSDIETSFCEFEFSICDFNGAAPCFPRFTAICSRLNPTSS